MHVNMQRQRASWNKRISFPGYRGTLPKSVRSSRVQRRDKWQIKQKKVQNDWSIFELLATVAEEILQEGGTNEGNASSQIGCGSLQRKRKLSEDHIFDAKSVPNGYDLDKSHKTPLESKNRNAVHSIRAKKPEESMADFQKDTEKLNNVALHMDVCSDRIDKSSTSQVRCNSCTAFGSLTVQKTCSPHLSSSSSGEILASEKTAEKSVELNCDDKHSRSISAETASWSLNGLEGDTLEAGCKDKYFQTDANIDETYCDNVMKCISQESEMQPQPKRKRSISESSEVCTITGHSNSGTFHDMHEPSSVKVGITSFMIPELSIDLPETATVANLKRAVMDAAINLLKSGLHVRVIHQGEKVADENATLAQMGVTCEESLDSLAFMLEPKNPDSVVKFKDSLSLVTNVPGQSWYTINGSTKGGNRKHGPEVSTDVRDQTPVGKYDATLDPYQLPNEQTISRPGLEDQKTMELIIAEQHYQETSSAGKRRTRRPFTVIEVAALVQAVELLGTGRWREVKQQAFDHADHRTYVDLKDKWKTLVHTAHIAPHQRRGEPLPQELLDRVLRAHTYWSAQAKQQEGLST